MSLEILNQHDRTFVVRGELRGLSKNLQELEQAMEITLELPDGTFVGTVVFEENFPECFGRFIIDRRSLLNLDDIPLKSRVEVELEKVKLKEPIEETIMNHKNIEYLYIVKSMKEVN